MTGELDFVERSHSTQLDEVASVLAAHGQPHEVLTGAEVNERFPGFSLPANGQAVFSSNAGILNPSLAMQTLQELAARQGAEIRDNSRVVSVSHGESNEGEFVVVALEDGGIVRAKRCIVTAGPWTKKLHGEMEGKIAIKPIATFGTYWKCDPKSEELYTPKRFPVFINYEDPWVYGLPMQNPADGVKVCMHSGQSVDPDTRQQITEQPAGDVAKVQRFLMQFMPRVDPTATSKVDLCMYSMTEDEDFILDFVRVPGASTSSKKVVVGAGFSGHGAKMNP